MFDRIVDYISQYVANKWLRAGIILLGSVFFSWLIVFLFEKVWMYITRRRKIAFDGVIIQHVRGPFFLFLITLGVQIALTVLDFQSTVYGNSARTLSVLLFMYMLGAFVRVVLDTWGTRLAARTRTRADETVLPLIKRFFDVFFFIATLLWVMSIWEVNITPYLAGLGIGGLVVGLAFQDSLRNIFGGISLVLDKNFNIGDAIKLESGDVGTIMDIGLRSTKLLTVENDVIFVPNGQLANMRITNYMRPNPRVRKTVNFGVAYGSDVDKVKKIVFGAIKSVADVYDEPPIEVLFVEMGDFSLKFQARFYVHWHKTHTKGFEATEVIYNALRKAKIEIPFPTQTVQIKKED